MIERITGDSSAAEKPGEMPRPMPHVLRNALLESGVRRPAADPGKRSEEIAAAPAPVAAGWRAVSNGEHFVAFGRRGRA